MIYHDTKTKQVLFIDIFFPSTTFGQALNINALESLGHHVSSLKIKQNKLQTATIIQLVSIYSPDIVIFNHFNENKACKTIIEAITILKSNNPELITAYCSTLSFLPYKEILEKYHCIDYIVQGKLETITPVLLQAIVFSSPLKNIKGIAYRNGYNQAISTG